MSLGYTLSRVRLEDQPQEQGTSRESQFSGTSCRGYDFAWVRVVRLPPWTDQTQSLVPTVWN